MIVLPEIGNRTAKELCGLFQESELLDCIAYLELVLEKRVMPGSELFRLGVNALNYSTQELWAVQNRLAFSILSINSGKNLASCPASIANVIKYSIRTRASRILKQIQQDQMKYREFRGRKHRGYYNR